MAGTKSLVRKWKSYAKSYDSSDRKAMRARKALLEEIKDIEQLDGAIEQYKERGKDDARMGAIKDRTAHMEKAHKLYQTMVKLEDD